MSDPRLHEAWEPELRHFARELIGHLASLSERIIHALGPLRISTEQRSDEPNGYSALTRRGPYERLLSSEWALQLENEDEFIRRATSGEHLFVELERRSPAVALEAWLLFDTGPSQLGAPRIAQLAALLAFHRRAREAGITLRWAPLWQFEVPEFDELTPRTVQGWCDARTAHEPTAGVLSQWLSRWPPNDDVQRDVWLVGGPSLTPLATQFGWNALSIDDAPGDGSSSLEVQVTPSKKSRPTRFTLALPEVATQVRLLRDPFGWSKPKPTPVSTPRTSLALEPRTELVFSHDGHRLLVRTAEGGVAALPLRNTSRAMYGWPTVATLPVGTRLVAAVWGSRRARGLVVETAEGALHGADWDGRLGERFVALPHAHNAPRPLPFELFTASWPSHLGWEVRGQWFDAERRLMDGRFNIARAHGAFVAAVREGIKVEVGFDRHQRWVSVITHPEQAWISCANTALAAACLYSDRVDVLTGKLELTVRSLPRALFVDATLQGLIAGVTSSTLLALSRDKRAVRSLAVSDVAPQWKEVVRARAPIETFAHSHDGTYLAWRDINGEVGVFSRTRDETVLRVHVRDATKVVV